jgi:hypothetical protein
VQPKDGSARLQPHHDQRGTNNRNHQGNRRQQDRFAYTPEEPSELQLYPSSVIRTFRELIIKNSNAKTYDETFYKLQMIMKSTFKGGKPTNERDLANFNRFGKATTEEPITIKKDTFDAKKWVVLFVRSIPDIKLPAYNIDWSVPFLWIFDNIQTSIDGISRSRWITETRTYDEDGELERSHEEYERGVNEHKAHRAKVLELLTDLIKNNHDPVCPSIEDPITIPSFTGKESVYMFYALRVAWMLITMHGNHINFGPELNPMTMLINPSKAYVIEQYVKAMRDLRCDEAIRTKYGEDLCDCLADVIEHVFLFHHSPDGVKGNVLVLVNYIMDITIKYLDTMHVINPVRQGAIGNPMETTIRRLKNRYSGTHKVVITAILQTYPIEALKEHLLDSFVCNECLTQHMFDSFLLMYKLYDLPTIRQAIIGGFCARSQDIRVHQIAYALVFDIFKPSECLNDDSFLNASEKADSLIIALESAPVDIARGIFKDSEATLDSVSEKLTTQQATKFFDCCEKMGIKCPPKIMVKVPTSK